MRCLLIPGLFFVCTEAVNGQQERSELLQLTLPPAIYAVAELPTNVYFDNIVLTEDAAQYRFQVACDIGQTEGSRWTATPKLNDVGEYQFKVTVFAQDGQQVDSRSTTLLVLPVDGGESDDTIRLLIIGDSLTHASVYPNEIARLMSRSGNPTFRMLGTHKPPAAADGVVHEGYGGWTWGRFVTKYEPNPDGTYRKRSSPFVFVDANGKPRLDVARYFTEHCDDTPPNYIVIMLGINDCFGAPPNDAAGMDAKIDGVLAYADTLLSEIQAAAPEAQIGFCLTTPPNARQEAFTANYKDRYTRWGWKRIQHRLVQRQLEYVSAKEDSRISMIPTQLNLDPVAGYPHNNAVHPNAAGYKDIGSTVYAWLQWQLAGHPVVQENAASTPTRKVPPIEDRSPLPRVLLIGDSISMGYTQPVQRLLKGKANVLRIPANGGPTTRGIANIDRWLGDGNWDVIHFNWGIHDLRHMPGGLRQVETEDYEQNLRQLVTRLKKTDAKLIWAATTPIPRGKLNPDRTFGDETEYNAIAAKVMQEEKVLINNLHEYVMPRFAELHKPSDLHFKPEGSEYLAKRVAKTIQQHLPESSNEPTEKRNSNKD